MPGEGRGIIYKKGDLVRCVDWEMNPISLQLRWWRSTEAICLCSSLGARFANFVASGLVRLDWKNVLWTLCPCTNGAALQLHSLANQTCMWLMETLGGTAYETLFSMYGPQTCVRLWVDSWVDSWVKGFSLSRELSQIHIFELNANKFWFDSTFWKLCLILSWFDSAFLKPRMNHELIDSLRKVYHESWLMSHYYESWIMSHESWLTAC